VGRAEEVSERGRRLGWQESDGTHVMNCSTVLSTKYPTQHTPSSGRLSGKGMG
jgi:hypothetical protein